MGPGSWLKPAFDRIMREVTFSCCSLYLKGILAAVTANDSLAHKVKMHTHAPHARTHGCRHACTHTHSHPGLCQANRDISEGQDMERWKVTPADTESASSLLLCIDKRIRQRPGRHAAGKSLQAFGQYDTNTVSSLGLISGRNPIQFLTSSSRCQHPCVQTLTLFLCSTENHTSGAEFYWFAAAGNISC